jgi:hypothetical protein
MTGGMPCFQRLSGMTLMPGTVVGSVSTTPPLTSARTPSACLRCLLAVEVRETLGSCAALLLNCVCRLQWDDA